MATTPDERSTDPRPVPTPPDAAPDALVPPADLALGPPNARAAVTHEPLARGRLQSRRFLETKKKGAVGHAPRIPTATLLTMDFAK